MHKTSTLSQRLLALMMAALMMLGTVSTASAHAAGEENGGSHNDTPYSITIYNDKQPNQNGKLSYTVTSHEDGTVSQVYDLDSDTQVYALEGDTITLYPQADEGYVLSSIGYVKAERVERTFSIKAATEQADGSYTFEMPAYSISVGAAFYGENDYYVVKETGTGNQVANVSPLHVINLGLNHAWLHQNAEEVSVDMYLDTRILEFEALTGKTLTFRMEIRQVGDSGYTLAGSQEYTTQQLEELVEGAQVETDEKGREYYVLRDVKIPVDADKDFELGREIYCTAMYTLDGWTNAVGAVNYRWGYSGGDRAYILENETPIPTSMVYLYNLEPETYHGALVAEAIDRVEEEMGITIETRYFNADNMTECIGYLAEWPGYDSFGELGVDRQPSEKTYKRKIVLYCSVPSMVRDKLGDYIRETGANTLSSKLTEYGAQKSFEEFYSKQETEATVFTAALGLSLLTYEAYNAVPEAQYGQHPLWAEFKAAYDECKAIINMTSEQEESVYNNARLKLLDVYLRILGKVQLDMDFEFVIEEYDADNYKITVDKSEFPEDLEVEYYWYDASKLEYLIIPKTQLYKVTCSISAVDDGPYYGFRSISLAVPGELEYQITPERTSIQVNFEKYASQVNTPEPITYIAQLSQNGELKQTLSNTTAETLTFRGLERGTEYTLKLYATNIVGRTTYQTETVTTLAGAGSSSGSGSSSTGNSSGSSSAAQPESQVNNPFTDVSKGDYFYDAVLWAVENNITGGTSADTFSPAQSCTRAQMMMFLWRAVGSPEPETSVCPYVDVAPDAYYYNAVLWAMENGITSGTGPDTFGPEAAVTRAQSITFLWRAAKTPAARDSASFADVAADAYYCGAVDWAVEHGITSGVAEYAFGPDLPCTRGQIVTFLYNYLAD